MKFSRIRTIAALATAALLTACGAGQQESQAIQPQTAAISVSSVSSSAVAAVPSTGAPVAPSVAANMPAPDCAAEGCNSLRIIDGNAEAFRLDVQRRDALQASLPQS